MLLPYLTQMQNPTKRYSVAFRGINYGDGAQEGEFKETYNLSTDKYPCITQRAARRNYGQYSADATIHAKEGLLVIDGGKVFYDGKEVSGDIQVTEGRKQTATVGKYIVIFPDKLYYDVEENKFASMEETYTGEVTFTENSITAIEGKFNFEKGDSVEISGSGKAGNNKSLIIRGEDEKKLTFDNTSFEKVTTGERVTIKREVPDLEFICESNYRLWGTKDNAIYSSKYSNPLNFKSFDGSPDDSYWIEVGSDGAFTGCIPYASHICFFKENTLHKLYGTKPSNFQITTANVYGVQSGCERSMHIVNEQLLYKGVNGVYAYTGGVPELISEKFGTMRFSEAVASCDGSRYYISMKNGNHEWNLFVYDVLRNIWLREDDTHAVDMTFHNGRVCFVDEKGGLYYIDQTGDRSNIEWSATFCTMHETMNERKVYSKFHLRMDLDAGAWVAVDVKTDNDTQWHQVYAVHNTRDEKGKTVSIPIMPNRCDSIDIRIRGKGECTVKSFIREFLTGSDV